MLAVLAHARATLGDALPLVLAGFSFGSVRADARREARQRAAPGAGRPRGRAASPSRRCPPDTIVIHGEDDEVVPLADVLDWARPQELPIVVFPGGGHFFHGRLPQLQRVITGMWQR